MENPSEKLLKELEQDKKTLKIDLLLTSVTLLGLLAGILVQFLHLPNMYELVFFGLTFLCGGLPITRGALTQLFHKKLDIDLLMILAAIAAAIVALSDSHINRPSTFQPREPICPPPILALTFELCHENSCPTSVPSRDFEPGPSSPRKDHPHYLPEPSLH